MIKQRKLLPYGRQDIHEDDIAAVVDAMHSDLLTTGPKVEEFENCLSETFGSLHTSVCSSGTAALHLAAMSAGVSEGKVAVVPSLTFLATANAVKLSGGQVMFADVDPETGLMSPENLLAALAKVPEEKLQAIFVVHLNGQIGDPKAIKSIADKYGVPVIEDACHAIGTEYSSEAGRIEQVGSCSHSDICTFSFHPVKGFTSCEGGAIMTNDERIAQSVKSLRSHGMVRDPNSFQNKELGFNEQGSANPWYYEMHDIGLNYRLTDVQCALGISQLKKFPSFVKKRRALVARYDANFRNDLSLISPIRKIENCNAAWHLYVVMIDFQTIGKSRSVVMGELRKKYIGSQVHYLPVHLQPFYQRQNSVSSLPGAEAYYERALSLPLHTNMTLSDVDYVAQTLIEICKG